MIAVRIAHKRLAELLNRAGVWTKGSYPFEKNILGGLTK